MPLPTALQIINEDAFPERLEQTDKGWRGVRTYRVTTDSASVALSASGLPAIGDPWDGTLPQLTVVSRATEYIGGRDQLGDGTGGMSKVTISYSTPTPGPFTVSPRGPGDVYSEWETKDIPYQQMYGYSPNNQTNDLQNTAINSGRGASRTAAAALINVFRWYAANAVPPIVDFLFLSRPPKLNAESISIPRIRRQGSIITFTPGQLLYRKTVFLEHGGLLGYQHIIEAAESFDDVWQSEDPRGAAFSQTFITRPYRYATWGTLW